MSIDLKLAEQCRDLQVQLQTLQADHKRLISDLYAIAEALGVQEEGFGVTGSGIAPSTMIERIEELKRWASYY